MATIIANKQTEIAVTISNGPATNPVWKIDGNVVQSSIAPLIIPADTFVAGTTHSISFSATNDCGETTRLESLTVTTDIPPPPPPGNLIINGTFDGLANWFSWSNGTMVVSNPSGKCLVDLTVPGPSNQLQQSDIVLKPSTIYSLKVDSHTEPSGKTVEIFLHNQESSYEAVAYLELTPTALEGHYEWTFTTLSSVPVKTRLRFQFTQVGKYYFDNIILEETTCPNPSCGITVIQQ